MRAIAATLFCCLATAAFAEDAFVKPTIVDHAIPASLSGKPGDVEAGKKVVVNNRQGNCLACHHISALNSVPFHGQVGPSLDGVAERYKPEQLRLLLTDSKQVFPDTVMPAFYKVDGFNRERPEFVGKTILTSQQVEDVIAFLETLK